jgi:hypothetical protein
MRPDRPCHWQEIEDSQQTISVHYFNISGVPRLGFLEAKAAAEGNQRRVHLKSQRWERDSNTPVGKEALVAVEAIKEVGAAGISSTREVVGTSTKTMEVAVAATWEVEGVRTKVQEGAEASRTELVVEATSSKVARGHSSSQTTRGCSTRIIRTVRIPHILTSTIGSLDKMKTT